MAQAARVGASKRGVVVPGHISGWRRWARRLEVLPFLLPGLALVCVFVLWPLVRGIQVSFYRWNIMPGAEQTWVGLANYRRIFDDPVVRVAAVNTLLYAALTVPGQMALGLLAAVGLNAITGGRVLLRTLYYIPVLTSWVVVSFIFKYLFYGSEAGPVNHFLVEVLGALPEPVGWLQQRWTAQVPIATLGIWKGVGWNMVMFLAALQSIPRALHEAAAIDGAGRWAAFWHVTMPLLRPVLLFVTVMLTIGAFNVFISVHLLTGGGPMDSTQVILSYMYDQGFKYFDFGYGFAMAVLLGVLIFAISWVQFRFLGGSQVDG